MRNRQDICQSAAGKLRSNAQTLKATKAVIGVDGFVDSIIDVVDTRQSFDKYARMETIDALGKKIVAAAGHSANYEFVVKLRKLGGNGPIYANALAAAGVEVDYIGSLGRPTPDEVFVEFGRRARLHSICEAGLTDALEFADGKLMLGKLTQLKEANWQNILKYVGLDNFTAMCDSASLLAMNNWTMLPLMGEIWQHVLSDVLPKLSSKRRMIFIDLADPEKRTAEDILRDLKTLSGMQKYASVTLGLNLKEAGRIAEVVGVSAPADENQAIQTAADAIRKKLSLDCIVIHPRRGAGAASSQGSAWFDGPMVRQPKISTGAGDHFNAGFCLGQLIGASLGESLCCGCASSGFYVRNAQSASAEELAGFTETLPAPER